MEVILIRHTSVDVPPGVCYGQTDVPLKPTFEAEAAVTAENLKTYLPFDHVYTSPLTRCVRLAAYCGYPDAEREERIMEINFGDWEMKPFEQNEDPRLQEWYADYMNVAATGGESFTMQYRRVGQFLDELRKKPYCTRCHLRTRRRINLRATLCRHPQSRRSLRRIDALWWHRPHPSRQGIMNEIVGPSSASVCTL